MIGKHHGFFHALLPAGRNGIYLTLIVDGKDRQEKVVCRIRHERTE